MMGMHGIFAILLIIAMVLTLGVLFVGVGSFALGGKFNQKYSNKLMRLRVTFQVIAIVLFAIVMLMSGK